ncbi:sugar kinase [Palleronia sp. LCG004]|uniref:carbohydrate kinase family protein n=1 Tax=Palleronia sp. LCG004 TaxID=3079304 RepID=UPI002943BFBE|nr:sugar kinase [Palleronia sp. LCG004]WOI58142.1 sugar kinase [Palleronia sp. LCG004]
MSAENLTLEGCTVVTIGEILVEFVSHQTGCGLAKIGTFSGPYPSGAPAIFVDQAARMGADAHMIGGVGEDGFGRVVLDRLRDDGVETNGVSVVPGYSTGTAFVSYDADGGRDFIFHLTGTAADRFDPDTALPAGHVALHVSAASLGSAPMRAAILRAVDVVQAAGGAITCDPNARPQLMRDDAARDALDRIMAVSDCLMPSTSDFAHLYPGASAQDATDRLLSTGARIVALKRGAEGATIFAGGTRYDLPGHAVEERDPTGAGDCFCGTFVAALTGGASALEAGRLANAAGAIAVTRRGPMEGNSTPEEIDRFLAGHRGNAA